MVNPAIQRTRFLAPGDKLGKHDLIRQIAVGGMAELYLARTVGLEGFEKLVVLKRILPQYANNTSFVTMFLNEARLAATLHHPNIAQVFDIDQDGADYFFSMEYVHGQDLGHLVASAHESGVPLSLDASLTLVAGLCAGLHYAHEKVGPDGKPLNVVHRDVSPSNVLVSYDGAVKLVDFGIARAGSTPATTRGGLKGKIAYMSPEQCRGKVTLDRRSDVFSIGTILYELTTGRLPFTDETEYGILNQIVNRDAEPPGRIVGDYPPALEAIVMRALARNPDQRYATALEMQKDIEDFAHENRLRVSPLVLARLMGTLYPTRLEEWDHARAQGAFFVEQHVVRTLIESGKGSEPSVLPGGAGAELDDDGSGQGDTVIGPPPVEDGTQPRPGPRARSPVPLPGMPPQRVNEDTATAQVQVRRPSSPALGGQPPTRRSDPSLRAPSPVPGSQPVVPSPDQIATAPIQASPRTPAQPPQRMPTPVPGMPGAVPIVTSLASMADPMSVTPMPGTLVTSQSPSGSHPALVYPVVSAVDVTERVRAPRAAPPPVMPGETALVQIGRSRLPMIILLAAGVGAAAVAGIIVFGGDKEDADATQPAVVEPSTEPDPAKPDPAGGPAAAKVGEPAKADDGAAAKDDPATAKADDGKADDGKADDGAAAKDDPATAKAEDPKSVKKPPKTRQQSRGTRPPRVTTPKKDPKKDPEKEPKWDPNAPFMPVRTDKK